MPSICPRGCSRLASGAVFMSVGVVQFLAGMIFMRSEYVYLIAGPDFWTSASNIAVGCLLGISASVWKQSRKLESKKHILRRHLLLALLFSGLIINATTLGILLLGKDNTLLSIRLESDGEHSSLRFASEVLVYAYVTSVCCPVICVVVTIVAISASCFSSAKKSSIDKKLFLNSPKKNRLRPLQWIYNHEHPDLLKTKYQEPVLSTTSESSSDDEENSRITLPKHENSVDDLQNVFSRMAQGKRDSILRDSTIMLRQLDLRRKNKYNALNSNELYIEPVLSRVRESGAAVERHVKPSVTGCSDNSKTGNPKRCSSEIENARLSSENRSAKHIYHSSDKRHDTQHRNAHEKFIQHPINSQSFVENALQYRNFKEKPRSRPKIVDNALRYSWDVTDYTSKQTIAAIHKKSKKMVDIEDKDFREKSILKKPNHGNTKNEFLKDHHVINEKKQCNEGNKHETTPAVVDDYFSPDESDFSPDVLELPRKRSSWAGEIVPIKVKSTSLPRLSCKLIPVASPVAPNIQPERDHPKISDDSGIASIQSNSFNSGVTNQNEFRDREHNLSSFRGNSKMGNKENMLEYPKTGSPSVKKYDLSKVVTMASISEEPTTEMNWSEQKAHCSTFYETTPTKSKSYLRQISLPSVLPGSSKETEQDKENSRIDDTPRRKRSASGKALRKLWSLAGPENHIDFLDQVVDNDSLIGLSEEELIARQFRNRSIRKAVQQRLKGEMMVMIENCSEV